MEYIDGSDFKSKFFKENITSIDKFQDIYKKSLQALSEFHKLKLVVNDIKPRNLM